jgi:hypothetical protein
VVDDVRRDLIRLAAVLDKKIREHRDLALGRLGHLADISEAVAILLDRNRWFQANGVWCDEVAAPDRMDAQLDDHRRWLRAVIGDLVACTDFHRNPLKTRLKVWRRRANSPDFT